MASVDVLKVKNIIAEVGEFTRALFLNPQAHHVLEGGREAVTIADVEGERQLMTRLTALIPGSIAVGEEDTVQRRHMNLAQPTISADDTVWFIDPLDGTKSFKKGRDDFALMVGLQQKGVLTHGWIYYPVQNVWIMGEVGSGTTLDGRVVTLATQLNLTESMICIDPYHFPSRGNSGPTPTDDMIDEEGVAMIRTEMQFWKRWPSSYSCNEIRWLLQNQVSFLFHANGLVWDNAAGVAIYRAAGGVVKLINGDDYQIHSTADIRMQKRGLLYAPSADDWQNAQKALAPLHAFFGRQGMV